MKASDYIADFLSARDVSHVFEVIGGMTTHLIDSIHSKGRIRIISVHHEQAAAFAAEGYARVKGVPGVAIASSGPGAINLLTGVGSCYFDSVPAVFITGQVNRNEQKGTRPIRQLGFQETDIVAVAASITKAAWQVQAPEEVDPLIKKAFITACSGRPGPVLLDIPMDIQRAEISLEGEDVFPVDNSGQADERAVDTLLQDILRAKRPLILAGGGLHAALSVDLFRAFVESIKVPVVNSLMAVDALPYSHPLRVGLIGTYGNRWANLAVGHADFLLVLGSRLDIRQTGSDTASFKGNRLIYHVDCEPGEINNRIKGCCPILSDLRAFLKQGIKKCEGQKFPGHEEWLSDIAELRRVWPDAAELRDIRGINPNILMHQISGASPLAKAFVVDVGQHQMWSAQSLEIEPEQRFITSGGMGAMGFALPAAMGVSFAYNGQPVVVLAGDGGFQLNIQELQTIATHNLPIKIFILNNRCYGMPRQFQQEYFSERYPSTRWGYSSPDFAKIAKAYGINSATVSSASEVNEAFSKMWRKPDEPFLLQVMIDPSANAYPKMTFGRPMTEMAPLPLR
jgi:acetolactate synthase I/II/III large subunit